MLEVVAAAPKSGADLSAAVRRLKEQAAVILLGALALLGFHIYGLARAVFRLGVLPRFVFFAGTACTAASIVLIGLVLTRRLVPAASERGQRRVRVLAWTLAVSTAALLVGASADIVLAIHLVSWFLDNRCCRSRAADRDRVLDLFVSQEPAGAFTRASLTGNWRAGDLAGTFRFSAGRSDNYLELYASTGGVPIVPACGLVQLSDDLSLRGFAEGAGLAALETITDPGLHPDPVDRLNVLVMRLHSQLPALHVCASECDAPQQTALLSPQNEVTPPAEDLLTALPQPSIGRDVPTWLRAAGQAVAEGRFRNAERLARQASAQGDADGAEFREALVAVRRAAKMVRRHPRLATAHLALAQAYFLTDAGPAAFQTAERAAVLDPTLGEAHAVAGFELLYHGDPVGALARLAMAERTGTTGVWGQALAHQLKNIAQEMSCERERLHWSSRTLAGSQGVYGGWCTPVDGSRAPRCSALCRLRTYVV